MVPIESLSTISIGSGIPRWVTAKSYPGQLVQTIQCVATPVIYTTVVTTGLIAQSLTIDGTQINDFVLRFQTAFEYYLITKVVFEIEAIGVSTGVTVFYVEENTSAGVPTSDKAKDATPQLLLTNNSSSPKGRGRVVWKPSRIEQFEWNLTSSGTPDMALLQVYTSAAEYGSPIVATATWIIRPIYFVSFRNLQTN
jgi:hypothetical protein